MVTKGEHVSNQIIEFDVDGLAPCNHEEADTRMFIQAKQAVTRGYKSIMINANDADVVVIAMDTFPLWQELGLEELWIA